MKTCLAVIFSVFASAVASAGVTEWTGAGGASIGTDANWTIDENGDDIYLVNSPNAAALGEGESFDAGEKVFYVGRGYAKNDQGEWGLANSTDHDKGATLNISGGTFTSSARVWVGGGYSDFMDSILNISGGEMSVAELFTGDCASNADRVGHPKVNAIYLSGGTLATAGDMQLGSFYLSTNSLVQTGGTFAPGSGEGNHWFRIGCNGKATYDLYGGEFVPPNEVSVGHNQGSSGVFNINKDVTLKTTHVGCYGGTGVLNINSGKTSLDVESDWYKGLNLGWWTAGSKGYLNIAEGAELETVYRESGYSNLIRIGSSSGTYGEVNVRGTLTDNFSNWQGGLLVAREGRNDETGAAASEGVLNNWGTTYSKGGVRVAYGTGSNGTLNNWGTVTSAGYTAIAVGRDSTGTLNLHGGVIDVTASDFVAGEGSNSTARVVVDGGVLANSTGRIRFGEGSDSKTYVEINGGVVSNSHEHVYIGGGGNEGTYTKFVMAGGTVYAAQNIYAGAWTSADTVINGGLLEAEGAIVIGEWDMAGDRTATLCVNGGTVFTKRVLRSYSDKGKGPTLTLKVSGGTFMPKAETSGYFENCGDVEVTGDGIGFDTNGMDIPMSQWGQTLHGDGGFTKKGAGTLEVRGTYKLTGKIRVEAGTLVLPGWQTIYCEGTEVADGAALNLNNSTIIPVTKKVVSSVWTNASGDGNAANAANWRSEIKYFLEDGTEQEELSAELDGVLPTADTDVTIPASSATRPDMSGLTVKSVTFVATSDVALRGDCSAPAIVKTAKAWYDFDDAASVVMADGIPVEVVNKGTAGETLDMQLFHPDGRKPAYGIATRYGRDVMSFTNSYGFVSKNAAGVAGDADRTLVAVSFRVRHTYPAFNGDGTPKDGEFEEQMFPIGIEASMWSPNYGEFRIGQWSNGTHLDYDDAAVPEHGFQCLPGLRDINPDEYAIWAMGSSDKTVSGSVMTESAGVENATPVTTGGNETVEEAKLFVGMRQLYDSPSAGEIAEVMMFDKGLTDEELSAVRTYLHTKWFTPFDGTTVPSNIALENDARLDFGGGTWTFESVKGAGTIGNANVVVSDGIEPGLVIEGTVTFADGAGFDFASLDVQPAFGDMVLLTCNGIVGEPALKNWKYPTRALKLRTQDNGDGTVSIVANVRNKGTALIIR